MIKILETPAGYEVASETYSHTFNNRAKAILAANALAIQAVVQTGVEMKILVPSGWGEPITVDRPR